MAFISGDASRQHEVLLFGDLSSTGFENKLRRLLHVKTNGALTTFLDRVGFALRSLIGALPGQKQTLFPHFTTLIDLIAKLGETEGTPVLRFCLLTIHEVAQFIAYYGEGSRHYPSSAKTLVIGPCTGSFAAAAISCSQTIPELIPVAVESVLAAFRTALCAYEVGRYLSGDAQSTNQSWLVVASSRGDVGVQEMVKEYVVEKAAQRDQEIWVATSMPNQTFTLGGRPAVLQDFITRNSSLLKYKYLEIESPFHAAHFYDSGEVEQIVDKVCDEEVASRATHIPFLSSAKGDIVAVSDFRSLLSTVIRETLQEPISWDLILASTRTALLQAKVHRCSIVPFTSSAGSMVSPSISNELGIQVDITETSQAGADTTQPTGRFEHSKIAIVGYSGRFPSADSNEAFWELLRAGRDVHREIPSDRFDWKTHTDPAGKKKNTSRVKYGCFVDEPGVFDTRFFNMSPREAENTDPAQRLAITATYEAMEMAGMVRNRTPSTQQDRVGVFFGTTSDDWREVNSGQNIDTYFIPGGNRAFVPGRISYFFRFSGPSLSIDTACSSSFAAIQAACSYLWRGEVDTAIAGGTNIITNPDNFAGLDRGHFLSTTGNCNAFDDGADGYCRADAVGSVILKRLEDAEADSDPIFGVIVGTNTNHSGQAESITRPHEGDQSSVFKRILRYANYDPHDVSYVEMHGTGTQAGDATEMRSVLSVFVPDHEKPGHKRVRPLHIGSAKANIGHAESASGVSSLIKALMMMKHNEIPPHVGIKTRINHNYPLDLNDRGVFIPFKPTAWHRSDVASGKRAIFLNNFSAAGGNTALLLEDAPMSVPSDQRGTDADLRSVHPITVTAKTPKSLMGNLNSLISLLESDPSVSLPALSYTTTARRMHHNYRKVISSPDTASLLSALKSHAAQDQTEWKPIPNATKIPQVVFMFTGQGTLYTGVGKSLFDSNKAFQKNIIRLNRLAQNLGFPAILGLIDGTSTTNIQEISPVMSHLALVCVQLALTDLWTSWGIAPVAVIGHSLGEYAAMYASGVLSIADVVYLVGTRATLLEKKCTAGTHAMLAVKAAADVVSPLIEGSRGDCELACANQPSGHVVSGPVDKVSELARKASDAHVGVKQLDIPFAFHSAQVEPILSDFEAAAGKGVTYHATKVPVFSPLLSKVIPAGDDSTLNAAYLTRACRGMVDFKGALEAAKSDGIVNEKTVWLEVGSHPACGGMIKGTLGSQSTTIASLRERIDAYQTLTIGLETLYLAGVHIDWNEYHRDFPAAHKTIDLPRYAWDLKKYWIQYRNDFCLTRGDALIQTPVDVPKPAVTKSLSPSVQQILEESHGADQSSILAESNIFDEKLFPILSGHVVHDTILCPSSLYADVAYTIAKYMLKAVQLFSPTTGLDVANVKVDNALIAGYTETTHFFRMAAKADWSSNTIAFNFYSVDGNGKRTTSHAKLDVLVTQQQKWLDEWKRNAHFVTARIEALEHGIHNGNSHKIKRGMAYKLFSAAVEYHPDYQGMQEVILDSERLEAVSTVNFQVGSQGFECNAKWLDSLGGIAGFIMNANDGVDSRSEAFINHGWERMRIAEPLEEGKTYQAYNRMQLVEKTLYSGDTYILDGGRVVALFEGVTFQGIPRQVLNRVLPGKTGKAAPKPVVNERPTQSKAAPVTPKPAASSKAPKPQQPAQSAPSSGVLGRIMAIISKDVGVSTAELKPETEFADLGIDSLLSITITSTIQEELGLEFPPSLFVDHPSVKDLESLVKGQDASDSSTSQPQTSGSEFDDDDEYGNETPLTVATPVDGTNRARVGMVLKEIIAEETSVDVKDLTPSTDLADVGVDSLLSLTITGKLMDALEVDVPGDFLMEQDTLQETEEALCKLLNLGEPEPAVAATKPQQPSATGSLHHGKPAAAAQGVGSESFLSSAPQATSVLLSGSVAKAKQVLVLFPDGSGSAASYAAFARTADPSIAIYGLNCPWRTNGNEMTRLGLDMTTMVAKYLVEVKRLIRQFEQQRQLPLSLGGWSAGGILAVEAVRQLHDDGTKIDKLVLFDSPNPVGLQNPPKRMYDFFDALGIFGGKNGTPEWLRIHFDAFIRVLDAYEPSSLPNAPPTLMMYARDGICKDPSGPKMEIHPDDPREMVWLLNNRTDFSADGWASVVGRDKIDVKVLDDRNHFTMMDAGPKMKEIGEIVTQFLTSL